MLNISFLACTKVKLWDLTVCIAVNGDKFQSRAVTLTLVRQSRTSNLSEIFSYTTMYSNFMLLDRLLFELSYTHTHTQLRDYNKVTISCHKPQINERV